MKNLKMFAISLVAFAAMTMGVHATGDNCEKPDAAGNVPAGKTKCVATVDSVDGETVWENFEEAWDHAAANGGTITVLADDTVGSITTAATSKTVVLDLSGHKLDTIGTTLTVNANGSLTIKGAGEINATSIGTELFDVAATGKLIIDGTMTIKLPIATNLAKVAGTASVTGARIEGDASKLVVFAVDGKKADITLNANVYKEVVNRDPANAAARLVQPSSDVTGSKLTITGGTYYTSEGSIVVGNGLIVKISNGDFVSSKKVVTLTKGDLEISGGNLTSKATTGSYHMDVIQVSNSAEGKLTITGGTFTSTGEYALSIYSSNVVYSISGGTFNGGKEGGKADGEQYPALYIDNILLTGLNNPATKDGLKGILTGGRYLVSIIGGRGSQSAATVQNYIVAEGATVTEDGNYKVINAKVKDPQDTQEPTVGDGDANDQKPAENVPNVPKTSDNILVYASLGLISAVSVGFTAKRKENN